MKEECQRVLAAAMLRFFWRSLWILTWK